MLTCSSVSGNQYIQGAALVLWNRSSRSFTGGSSGLSGIQRGRRSNLAKIEEHVMSLNMSQDVVLLTFLLRSLLFALAFLSAFSVP